MSTDPSRKKIALFGAFGAGNLGNECTLKAMLHNLRRRAPNTQITCICAGPEETALRHGISAYSIRELPLPPMNNGVLRLVRRIFVGIPLELYRWFKALGTLRGTDRLVMIGTGMLTDVGTLRLGLLYDILRWSLCSKLCRCRLLFVSVGAGPIRRPLSRYFVKAALALADYRSYRDGFSRDYLKGMGVTTDGDRVVPDLAFSLPRAAIPSSHQRDSQRAVVGVGLITYSIKRTTSENDETIYRDYLAKVATFVRWLVERKYTVRLLIGDIVYDTRVRRDLRELLEARGLKYDDSHVLDEPAGSVEELLSQMAGTDLVVASRFHNVLLALMLGKPVVAISFHEKVDSLMSAVGLTEFCQDIEQIDVDWLKAQFATLETNAESLKIQIQQKTATYRRALDEQYEEIFQAPEVRELVVSRS